jgi:hypothetical protein
MKILKLIILSFFCSTILMSCQSVKEGLAGKQRKGGDEFLVKKKNPLVKPKNFNELPTPKNEQLDIPESEINDIEKLLKIENKKTSKDIVNSSNLKSLEKTILEKINKN